MCGSEKGDAWDNSRCACSRKYSELPRFDLQAPLQIPFRSAKYALADDGPVNDAEFAMLQAKNNAASRQQYAHRRLFFAGRARSRRHALQNLRGLPGLHYA